MHIIWHSKRKLPFHYYKWWCGWDEPRHIILHYSPPYTWKSSGALKLQKSMLHFYFLFNQVLANTTDEKVNRTAFVIGNHFTFIAAAIFLSFWEISENDGLVAGSEAQQLSIKDFHSGSHHVGIWGRNVLFTIPPANRIRVTIKQHQNSYSFFGKYQNSYSTTTISSLKYDSRSLYIRKLIKKHTSSSNWSRRMFHK